jgi:hypothetical protein
MVAGGWGDVAGSVSVADSSGGVNWSGFSRSGTSGGFYGVAGVYYKYFTTAPGSISVTASFSNINWGTEIAVKVLTGVDSDNPIGATTDAAFGADVQDLSANLTPTVLNSLVYGAINFDDTSGTSVNAKAGTDIVDYYYVSGHATAVASIESSAPTSALTSTNFGVTIPDFANRSGGAIQLVEVVPAPAQTSNNYTQPEADTEVLSDSAQVVHGIAHELSTSDDLNLSDVADHLSGTGVSESDTETLSDSVTTTLIPATIQPVSDFIGLGEVVDIVHGVSSGSGSGTVTEDASSPAPVHGSGSSDISSDSFSPPAGSFVVAIVVGGWANQTTTFDVSDSSGGGNWDKWMNSSSGAFAGVTGVAYKYFPTAPGSITVTASYTQLNGERMLSVKVLNGVDSADPIGSETKKSFTQNTTEYIDTITRTVTGSMIYGSVNLDDVSGGSITAANSDTEAIDSYINAGDNSGGFTFESAEPTATLGDVTLGGTLNNGGGFCQGSIAMIEVLPEASVEPVGSTHYLYVTDSESLSDTPDVVLNVGQIEKDYSDTEGLSDTATHAASYVRSFADTEALTDEAIEGAGQLSAFEDNVDLADSLASTASFERTFTDGVDLSDAVVTDHEGQGFLNPGDVETLSDSADVQLHVGGIDTSDTETLSDSATTVTSYRLDLTDALVLSDDARTALSNPNGPIISDIIGLSDSAKVELIMPHSSPGFGEIAIDRFYVIERETAKEGNDGKLSISGQESSPPTTVNLVTFLHGQISGLEEGRLVPVVFRDKAERDGYYVVGNSSSSLTDYQDEVAAADWEIELDRMGSDTEVDIQSRLTGVVRVNDFSLTGQRWHAPAQVHYAYYTGSTIPSFVNRASSYGTMKGYLDVPDNSSPKWGCPVANYKGGRVKLLDELEVTVENEVEGVDRRLSTDTWSLDNGLVKIKPGSTGSLDIQTFSGSSWHSKQVDVQVDGTTVSSWSGANLLRNDLEQIVLRLVAQPDANSPGRTTLDLTLRRGSRFVEGYLQNSSSATLTVQSHTSEGTRTATTGSGYVTATSNDSNGNRFVAGSSRTFTDPTRGGVSASNTTKMDFFWGSVVGGGSAQTGDTAVDLRNQYIGCMSELTYAVRR